MNANEARKIAEAGSINTITNGIKEAASKGFTEIDIPETIHVTDNVVKHFTDCGYSAGKTFVAWGKGE